MRQAGNEPRPSTKAEAERTSQGQQAMRERRERTINKIKE